MKRLLFDVNVLAALAWPNHVHHPAAQRWFADQRPHWATTPVTECGFVRVSANPRFVATAVSPPDAIAMLATMVATGDHAFFPDAVRGVTGAATARLSGHRQVTDAHLLAVASSHGGALATFDRGVGALTGPDDEVVVVPT